MCNRQEADCFCFHTHPSSPKWILLMYNGSDMALPPGVHFQSDSKRLLLRPWPSSPCREFGLPGKELFHFMQNNVSVWNLSSTEYKIKPKTLKYPGRQRLSPPTPWSAVRAFIDLGKTQGSSPWSEPGKHWLESGSPTSRMSVLTTKFGWSSSSCFTPPWIWWHFYWNRYICE